MKTKVSLLGIGAAKIELDKFNIYVDAFNEYNSPPSLNENDIILFTHDDKDHFLVESLIKTLKTDNIIIGPPSIVFPIWQSRKISKERIKVSYPKEYTDHEEYRFNDILIKVFNTEHFLNWHNTHISFLLEIDDKSIYFTGDSKIRKENEQELSGIHCIIYSLLQYEIVKDLINKKYGKYFHFCELLELKQKLNPNLIICNHLINCDWAVNPQELNDFIVSQNLDFVKVPISPYEEVVIE